MKLILQKANKQYRQNLPFVIYKKPNNNNVKGLFQQNDTLFTATDCIEKGFVFTSFDSSKTVLIPENQSETISAVFQEKAIAISQKVDNTTNDKAKNNFENLVAKGIQAIENKQFKKVVLSRKETVDLVDFDWIAAFEKLAQLYPSTFAYCFFHPKVGIWLGATPEQLLKANDKKFNTIALAGTQKDTGSNEVIWPKKEQEEQQIVTDYIVEKIKDITSEVEVSEPYSLKAGSIWHIKTDISGTLNSSSNLCEVVQLLHPTPAVCGLPKDKSKAFILENENYDRTFYTGFLGELNVEDQTDLFVNLRCMEISGSQAHLYMGCGITKESIPEKEWEESCNKSATMKRVL
ncbi:isochorismate synthase [Flavobacterium sp.]|uniref:isochorismate synthase n=1 Tax=Flavobacterium sp. TaxID=239 RepID=UPI0025BBAEA5|nr:isochorismate synthase [Flavobacterium sp.]MBA4275881.1 isochorismate synthase [Flavobacterium sp.]